MNNRAGAETFILNWINKITEDADNVIIYKNLFAKMTNSEFDVFINKSMLPISAPNFTKVKLSVERNLKLAKELGHDFFQRIWIGASGGNPTYLTPIPYLVMDLPIRRASQLLIKKLAVADNNKSVDTLTGQLSSTTKGAKISYPELQVLSAMNLDKSITELMKYRGGDSKGFLAMNAMISKYGTANQSTLVNYSSGVESTRLLKTFLTCCHLKNNL